MADLINFSFLDLARVVVAEACGVERTGLIELLYGRDRIHASLDALIYAKFDLQIRREERCLITRREDDQTEEWRRQHSAVTHRLTEAKRELRRQRNMELTAHGVQLTPQLADDPREQARLWLAEYLHFQFAELFEQHAAAAGLSKVACQTAETRHQNIEHAIARQLLNAPVSDSAERVLALDDREFRLRVLRDASRQVDRDDTLCHPLLLHRWRRHLKVLQAEIAPGALSPSTQALPMLVWRHVRLSSPRDVSALIARRRLFANLLQRYSENRHLRHAVEDAISIAEQASPDRPLLTTAARAARDDLVRHHPDLYRSIRDVLKPHETRYGRLLQHTQLRRQELRDQVLQMLSGAQ
ncbi:hypothetical protein ACFVJM_00355 [Streptomyces virginiae]|uniref:hypothetical protein n=1 Tax=Streptomyces virginiae TaxID=1961 RepID=UPI00363D5A1D